MKLQELAEHAMTKAKGILQDGESVCPMLLMYSTEKNAMTGVPLPFYTQDRPLALTAMKFAVQKFEADMFVFVMEAWLAMPKTEEEHKATQQPGYAPSRDPNRIDAITVIGKSKDGAHVELVFEVKKKGKKILFKDLSWSDGGEMRMMGVLDNLFGTETVQ